MKQTAMELPVEIARMVEEWKREIEAAREALRDEMAAFRAWVAEQKGAALPAAPALAVAPSPAAVAAPVTVASAPAPSDGELSEEILMVLAAAVAAVMGKKARIRRARPSIPMASSAWAQQGRVFVQASHNLGMSHR